MDTDPSFIVTLKWGQRKLLEAPDLRTAQDRAYARWGPHEVIYVQERRAS